MFYVGVDITYVQNCVLCDTNYFAVNIKIRRNDNYAEFYNYQFLFFPDPRIKDWIIWRIKVVVFWVISIIGVIHGGSKHLWSVGLHGATAIFVLAAVITWNLTIWELLAFRFLPRTFVPPLPLRNVTVGTLMWLCQEVLLGRPGWLRVAGRWAFNCRRDSRSDSWSASCCPSLCFGSISLWQSYFRLARVRRRHLPGHSRDKTFLRRPFAPLPSWPDPVIDASLSAVVTTVVHVWRIKCPLSHL